MLNGGAGCDYELHLILGHLGQSNTCSAERRGSCCLLTLLTMKKSMNT